MKRFSALAFRQQKTGKYADLAFLQQAESPMQNLRSSIPQEPSSQAGSSLKVGTNVKEKDLRKDEVFPMNTTKAMKLLMSAVLRRKYNEAESIFASVPRLSQRGAAIRLLVKVYCEQFDFVSAKALLFQGANNQGLAKTGDAGVARFVAHLTYTARNSQLIDEAFQRTLDYHAAEQTDISPKLVTTVLNGLLFLGERDLFETNWRELNRKTQKLALESHVLRLLLDENWQEAHDLWAELVEDGKVLGNMTVWYTALRFFLTETRNLGGIDRVLALMDQLRLQLNPDFTALLLRYIPHLMENEGGRGNYRTARQWIQYARDRGWPLDAQSGEQALFAAWQQRLPPKVFDEVRRELVQPAKGPAKGPANALFDRQKLAMGTLFNPFRHEIRLAHSDKEVLDALHMMLKRGMTIPYDLMVEAFESAVEKAPSHRVSPVIEELSSLIRQHEYPLHCAGIDLSIVELHSKANKYDSRIVRMLLAEYLAQYPLVNNNLGQLTRIGLILLNAGEPQAALTVLDTFRENEMSCEESASPEMPPISFTNHDCASLQIMLAAKAQLDERLHPTLESLHTSGIYFDQTFIRKVKKLLNYTGEDPDILNELVVQNKEIMQEAMQEARSISQSVCI